MQEPLASLATEYERGSALFQEQIEVRCKDNKRKNVLELLHICSFPLEQLNRFADASGSFVLIMLVCQLTFFCPPRLSRAYPASTALCDVHVVMATASSEASCLHSL